MFFLFLPPILPRIDPALPPIGTEQASLLIHPLSLTNKLHFSNNNNEQLIKLVAGPGNIPLYNHCFSAIWGYGNSCIHGIFDRYTPARYSHSNGPLPLSLSSYACVYLITALEV